MLYITTAILFDLCQRILKRTADLNCFKFALKSLSKAFNVVLDILRPLSIVVWLIDITYKELTRPNLPKVAFRVRPRMQRGMSK